MCPIERIDGALTVDVYDRLAHPRDGSTDDIEMQDLQHLAGGHSHSMVPGGLLVTSSTTRLTSATSLVTRVEIRSSTS